MKLIQISAGIRGFKWECVCSCVTMCKIKRVCDGACTHTGQLSRPEALSVGVFLEPLCHLPPNSNNVVDQQLFTNRQEDGTNLITPYSPISPSLETVSISAPCMFLDSRPPQVDSDSNYEYRVPLKWP